MALDGFGCVSLWRRAAASAASSCGIATVPSGPAARDQGDRTDGTDESEARHDETLAYCRELRHLAAVPGLRIRVSTRPRGLCDRVEDASGSTRPTGSSRRRSGSAIPTLSLIHISEPTRRTPISYAVFCLKKK